MHDAKHMIKRKHTGVSRAIALLLCVITLVASFHLIFETAYAGANDTVNITVNYVYASNQSMVDSPYRAQIAKGAEFKKSLDIPEVLNYSIPADKAEGLAEGIELSKKQDDTYSLDFNLDSVESDVTVTLYYVAGQAKYMVYHYYQNLEDEEYGDPTIVELTGDIDAYTQAVAVNKDGYSCKGVSQTTIAADGTTKVEIYYDHSFYTVIFDVNGGINGPEPIYAKYGTTFEANSISAPRRPGYKFMGWEPMMTDTVTVEGNVTYKAVWQPEKGNSDYTIVIWGQNANDNEYSYISSYEAWGNVGHEVSWDEDLLISHVHTADCYADCSKEEHTHSKTCYSCGKDEHVHSGTCCSIPEHVHGTGCYSGVGGESITGSLGMPQNPSEGQVYNGRISNYIYIGGNWYYYSGNVASGNIAPTTCNTVAHTHGTGCDYSGCKQEVHVHSAGCLACGKEAHTHNDACTGAKCNLSTTKKYMSSLHPGESLWVYEKSDTVTIDANGKTVLNVYFTRKEFTLHFRKANSDQDDYGSITARWGKNIKNEYEAVIEKAGDSFWSENKNASSPWTNYIGVMPKANKTYYLKTDSSSSKSSMTYYGEDLNGTYQLIFTVTFSGTGYTVTDEDKYEFEGYTYDHANKTNGENCNGAKFYYKRNKYKLEFYSASRNTADSSYDVLYQKSLAEYDYIPTQKPVDVEDDAVFVGWYQNPECTGEEYDLTLHKMPSHNIALYAKWVNGLYTVRTFTDDSMNTLYTYTNYDGVQDNIEKYTLADEPTEPAKDGYVFAGWFYKDGEQEKPFSFTMPITRDYDLYPKFSEPTTLTYTVHYYKEGTTQKIADDRTNSVLVGTTVTEKAKMGIELNLLPAADRNKYYPMSTSTSTIIDKAGKEIIFYYMEAEKVKYTVYYQDAAGNDLIDSATKETDYSTVTEVYVPIDGYAPRQYRITLDLSADETKNKIIFIYDPTLTSLTIQKSGAEDIDEDQTFVFNLKGTDNNTKDIAITVTVHGNGKTTITDLPVGSYTITEDTTWSWRYEPKGGATKSITLTYQGATVTFENERSDDKWVDDNAYVINHFKKNN